MRQAERQTKKKTPALPGQLDLFAASGVPNKSAAEAANDGLEPVPAARATAVVAPETALKAAPNEMVANNNEPEKPKRGRPRSVPPISPTIPTVSKQAEARDRHSYELRDEWWNSQMVCAFLKISRKTLWERRRAKNLDFPRPAQLGGARNLYRASAIRAWAERIADAEY